MWDMAGATMQELQIATKDSLQHKREKALAYLADKHMLAKDSKFKYSRSPTVLVNKQSTR